MHFLSLIFNGFKKRQKSPGYDYNFKDVFFLNYQFSIHAGETCSSISVIWAYVVAVVELSSVL